MPVEGAESERTPASAVQPAARAARRCIAACAPGASLPTELGGLLADRGVELEHATSPLDALASFVASDSGRGRILLIVEPGRAAWGDRLARAVERYAPHAIVWAWEAGSKPALRPFVREGAPARPAAPEDRGSPLLRLVDADPPPSNGRHGSGLKGSGANGAGTGGGVLDADELRLLLGRKDERGERHS